MQTAPHQGWSTLREGSQYFLYRSVSHIPLSTLESFIQKMQVCQNQHIAVPELVRMPDGEVYLRESRGQRSFEDFLQQSPTTSTKLFLIQQLVKLVRNLHTFVGTEHGDLHIECLSIGLDDELVLGGLAPVTSSDSMDLENVKTIIRSILSNPHEQELCKELCTLNLSRMNQRIKRELAAGNWDELLSDWTETVSNTTYEEPSDELSIEEPVITATPSDLPSAEVSEDESLWDFEDTEVVTANDLAGLDDLDFLDDLDLDDLPTPQLVDSPSSSDNIKDVAPSVDDEWDVDDLPTPSNLLTPESTESNDSVIESSDNIDPLDTEEFDLESLMDNFDDEEDFFAIDALDEFDETEFFDIPSSEVSTDYVEETIEEAVTAEVTDTSIPNASKENVTNDVFSHDSLLETPDVPVSTLENVVDEDEDELDWFTENTETVSESIAETSTEPVIVEPTDSNETWVWMAGVAVVAGGVFAVLNRDTTQPPEVVIGNDEDNTELAQAEDNAKTVAKEIPSEVSNQTEANVIATDSTTVEPIKTEAPTVKVDKPVVAKTTSPTESSKSPKENTPFKSVVKTAKVAPVVKTVKDLPAPKKKTATATSRVMPEKTAVATKPAPKQDITPEVTKPVVAKVENSPALPPVTVKTPSKAEPPTIQQKPVVEKAKPVVAPQKSDQGTQNLIADLVKSESVEQEPTSENNVDSMTETTEPPAMVQQTEPKVEPPTQKVVVVEQPIAEEPVVEEPVADPILTQPESEATNTQVEPKQEVEVTPTPTTEEPIAEEPVVEEPVVKASVPSLDLNSLSNKAFSGKLSSDEMNQLLLTAQDSPDFTRANAIALTQAQRTNDVQRIGESLENLLSVDANTHKPVYLLAMAQYQFNTQNIDGARDYLLQAENNWQHIQRDQLVILRAQRDNIVAHISYTAYLETGSEDSRLQSITQFRKVQREARRGKLTSMFERAEAKMQFLQRKAQ